MSQAGWRLPDVKRTISAYYLAAPLFLLIDLLLGWNIRTAALEGFPVLHYGYYPLCYLVNFALSGGIVVAGLYRRTVIPL